MHNHLLECRENSITFIHIYFLSPPLNVCIFYNVYYVDAYIIYKLKVYTYSSVCSIVFYWDPRLYNHRLLEVIGEWGLSGSPPNGGLGPTRSTLQPPATNKTSLSWVLSLHHCIAAGLLVEDFLALDFVIIHRYSSAVIETKARPIRRNRIPSLLRASCVLEAAHTLAASHQFKVTPWLATSKCCLQELGLEHTEPGLGTRRSSLTSFLSSILHAQKDNGKF